VITISSASRAGRGLSVPGAFASAGSWPAAGIGGATGFDGANGAGGATGVNEAGATRRPTAGTSPLPGQALAQSKHVYNGTARMDAGKRDATGSQSRRAPV
jgi:hypothetical protein